MLQRENMDPLKKACAGLVIAATMISSGLVALVWTQTNQTSDDTAVLGSFSSKYELSRFVKDAWRYQGSLYGDPRGESDLSLISKDAPSYSRTNVQVAGVDELDIVKTDGEYIYVTSNGGVSVVRAYPPDQLANITLINQSKLGMNSDKPLSVSFEGVFVVSGKLVVITSWWEYSQVYTLKADNAVSYRQFDGPWTSVSVFDMTDPSEPKLELSASISGWRLAARLIDQTVYVIAQSSVLIAENMTALPEVIIGGAREEIPVSEIRYDPEMKDACTFTNFLAVDVTEKTEKHMSVLSGYSSTVYVSMNAIYFTVQKWQGVLMSFDSREVAEDADTTRTTIYRITFDGLTMTASARGDVRGWLLNQFSMDENGQYLRVATTTGWINASSSVYILDSDLQTIGALKGIAPDERIYSSRFVGDTLYLVTFRQVDPLFVIDLSPPNPKVVGELTMPGFSTYLHPVDQNHVLGIGSENGKAKISLFDVSDRSNPVEQSKWILTDYQRSSAVWDHKEVLVDLERNLLVIPILAQNWSNDYLSSRTINAAFVFNLSVEDGIQLRGVVEFGGNLSYYSGLRRSLYIGDYLYTISSSTIKVNLLTDLSDVASITYYEQSMPYYYYHEVR